MLSQLHKADFMMPSRLLIVVCSLALSACSVQAPPGNAPVPQSGPGRADRVWFTGSSNIRRFTCTARQVYVSAEAAPEDFVRTRQDGVPAVRTAAMQVPVSSLDCGIGLQNSHLFQALGATANPTISFSLGEYSVERSDNLRRVRMLGALRIAGVERRVVLNGSLFRDAEGRWMLRGARVINLRDFGILPPRRFLGLLRVRDEVVVHFDVAVRPLIDPLGVLMASLQ